MTESKICIAAMADLHYKSDSQGKYQSVFSQIGETANLLLLCGDLVDKGLPAEAEVLAKDLISRDKTAQEREFESTQRVSMFELKFEVVPSAGENFTLTLICETHCLPRSNKSGTDAGNA